MSTHTPGPWHFTPETTGGKYRITAVADSQAMQRYWAQNNTPEESRHFRGVQICTQGQTYNGSGERYGPQITFDLAEACANARLIAAAPELLAALQRLLDMPREQDMETHIHITCMPSDIEQARAAIAKATQP